MKKILTALVLSFVVFVPQAFASTTYLGHFTTECSTTGTAIYKFENNSVASPYKWEVIDSTSAVVQSGNGIANSGEIVTFTPKKVNGEANIKVSWPKNDGDWNYGNTQDNNTAYLSQARCEVVVVAPISPSTPAIVPVTIKTISVNGQTYTVVKNPTTIKEQIISLVSQLMDLYK